MVYAPADVVKLYIDIPMNAKCNVSESGCRCADSNHKPTRPYPYSAAVAR